MLIPSLEVIIVLKISVSFGKISKIAKLSGIFSDVYVFSSIFEISKFGLLSNCETKLSNIKL